MIYKTSTFLIKCLTSLHVGSGDNNYGVVDKQVQRDPISNIPIIHASSLKGALRDFFKHEAIFNTEEERIKAINDLFGSDKNDEIKQGNFRFMEAWLLSIPVRGKDDKYFYRATSEQLITKFNTNLGNKSKSIINLSKSITYSENGATEFKHCFKANLVEPIGDDVVYIKEDIFKKEVLPSLPIIARNCLDNGESKNLWYEEYIPAESVFYFGLSYSSDDYLNLLIDKIKDHKIQIGANATIGYGLCSITALN